MTTSISSRSRPTPPPIGSRPAVRCWITPTPWCLAKDYSLHARKWMGTACHRDHRCPTAGTCQADRQSLADQRPAQLRNLQQLGPGGGRQFRRNHSSKWRGNNSGYAGLHALAAGCQGQGTGCTHPPTTCEGGMGVAATTFNIPIPMPTLRSQ